MSGLEKAFLVLRMEAAMIWACSRVTRLSSRRKEQGLSGARRHGEAWQGLRIEETQVLVPALRPGQAVPAV